MSITGATALPTVIQGGMGIGVSNWVLARAVARAGQLGVVSGTAMDSVLVRRLQDGDVGGHMRRAMANFPLPSVAERVLGRYLRPEGRPEGTPYVRLPMYRRIVSKARTQLTMLANFVEVFLAKEGHGGRVGINLLTKVQMPNLASLYGAMLAGVDYVLMGAGIPREIPGVLDRLAGHEPASLRLDVEGADRGEVERLELDPKDHRDEAPPPLDRPRFLPIVSSDTLATVLARKAKGGVDGFVVERPSAGGHNAPPRGRARTDDHGEPVYGERDVADLERIRRLGLPFWVAGDSGSPKKLLEALDAGATGVQVGTLFAYCAESGLADEYKRRVLASARRGGVDVRTDPRASPTGFPFKVVELEGGLSEPAVYAERERVCDLGYLRTAHRREDGRLGYRCPAEPVETYVKKGGAREDAAGRKCLCNALMANIGHAQVRSDGAVEPPLLTSGDAVRRLPAFATERRAYTATEVIDYLLSGLTSGAPRPEEHVPL